jgi:hypothetical protein
LGQKQSFSFFWSALLLSWNLRGVNQGRGRGRGKGGVEEGVEVEGGGWRVEGGGWRVESGG